MRSREVVRHLTPAERVDLQARGDVFLDATAVPMDAGQQPVVVYMQAPFVAESESSGYRWDRLACYVAGLAMLALVVVLLVLAGVVDVSASGPELQRVRPSSQVDLVGPSR